MIFAGFIIPVLFGYVAGSIPFGLVITKLAGLGDIRAIGSGNIGATNVLRTGRKDLALLTLLLDGGKGAIAVLLMWVFMGRDASIYAGLGAVIGHAYPVWLGFKGGKGVATTLGTLLAMHPWLGVIACAVWLVMAGLFRISSLAALTALGVVAIISIFKVSLAHSVVVFILTGLVYMRHKDNIKRLLSGTEPKIGDKKKQQPEPVAEIPHA